MKLNFIKGKGGLFFMVKPSKADPTITERVWGCRWTDKETGKRHEAILGREDFDGLTEDDAFVKLVQLKKGEAKTITEERAESKARAEEQQRNSLKGLWNSYRDFVDHNGKAHRDKAIYKTDAGNFRKHIYPALGKIPPHELTEDHVKKLSANIREMGLKAGTVRHNLALLKRILKHGGITIKFQMPKVTTVITEDLNADEMQRLLKALAEADNRAVADAMLLIMVTGMRQGKTRKLKVGHCDFHRGPITIKDPKGGKDGVIQMSEAARKIIMRQFPANAIPHPSSYVFTIDGKQLTPYSRTAKRIANKAGLPKSFRACHGLRHWYLTELAAKGTPIEVLRQLANHASIQTTQRYLTARNEQLVESTDYIGDMIDGAL